MFFGGACTVHVLLNRITKKRTVSAYLSAAATILGIAVLMVLIYFVLISRVSRHIITLLTFLITTLFWESHVILYLWLRYGKLIAAPRYSITRIRVVRIL